MYKLVVYTINGASEVIGIFEDLDRASFVANVLLDTNLHYDEYVISEVE